MFNRWEGFETRVKVFSVVAGSIFGGAFMILALLSTTALSDDRNVFMGVIGVLIISPVATGLFSEFFIKKALYKIYFNNEDPSKINIKAETSYLGSLEEKAQHLQGMLEDKDFQGQMTIYSTDSLKGGLTDVDLP